jgi:hypothetical protein
MKLKEMEIKDSIETLLATGLFRSYLKNHLADDGYCLPQHLIFLNSNYYFYMDHNLPYYLAWTSNEGNRGTKISIMDFGEKGKSPPISLEDFISRLSSNDAVKFLFYLDLFV